MSTYISIQYTYPAIKAKMTAKEAQFRRRLCASY
jgi:hypothetical protein